VLEKSGHSKRCACYCRAQGKSGETVLVHGASGAVSVFFPLPVGR